MARKSLNIKAGFDQKFFNTSAQNLQRSLKKAGRNLQRTGKNLALSLTAPAIALGGLAVREFAMFEQSMAKVKAISGATSKELAQLTDLSKQLGLTTRFTATEVANLELNYAKLGFSVDEINQITEATLQLALATGEDLADSAEVAGQTLRGFNLDASEMQRIVDLMANSFSSSALTLERFSVSMGKIAPVANAAGVSLERTVALQSALVDSGVEASTVGTSLRRIFIELANGGLTYNEAMEKIRTSTNKVSTATALFGKRAFASAIILSDQSDKVEELTKKYQKSGGAAKRMADIMDKTLQGSLFRLKSAVEGLAISFGEKLAPFVLKIANKIAEMAKRFSNLSDESKTLIIKVVAITAAIGPLTFALGGLSVVLATLARNPIVAAVTALASLAVIIGVYTSSLFDAVKETNKLSKSQKILADTTDDYTRLVKNEKDELKVLFGELKKTKKGTKERNDLLVFANKVYGTTLKNIEDEGRFISQLDLAYTDLVKSIKRKIAIQLKEDALTPLLKEQISLSETLEGLQRRLGEVSEFPEGFDLSSLDNIERKLDFDRFGEGTFEFWRTLQASIIDTVTALDDNADAQDKLLSGDLFKEAPEIKLTKELFGLGKEVDETNEKLKKLSIEGLSIDNLLRFITNVGKLRRDIEDSAKIEFKITIDKDTGALRELVDSLITDFDELKLVAEIKARELGDSIGEALKSSLNSLATEAVTVLGEFLGQTLAGNESALENLGKGLLNAVGGFMTQFGAAMISLGIAQLALGEAIALGPLGAPLAIAAGIALVAAGAAISSLSKKGIEGSGGGGSFVSASSRGGGSFDTGIDVQEIRISGRDLILVEQRERRLKR